MTCDLTNPIFTNEAAAVAHMEQDRWPNGVSCPLCGSADRTKKMGGETQAGMFVCYDCKGKFTVRTGTVFERSHIPLHKWLLATYLMGSSKKGISAHQLHRALGITYKSAWFMAHRIREAMAPARGSEPPLGGDGFVVEADETYIGRSKGKKVKPGSSHKMAVLSLVERGGDTRSTVVKEVTRASVMAAIRANVDPASTLHTDGAQHYKFPHPGDLAGHESVDHNKQYVRKGKSGPVHTNTLEGYFSVLKRGLVGTYQHVSEQHLPRYLAEFDFRQNTREKLGFGDAARANRILKGAEGKRLTYRQVG